MSRTHLLSIRSTTAMLVALSVAACNQVKLPTTPDISKMPCETLLPDGQTPVFECPKPCSFAC